jgi:cell division protein FtsW
MNPPSTNRASSRLGRTAGAIGAVARRHRPDYQILLYMGLLMLVGLVVMYAIGPQRANVLNSAFGTENYSDTYFFIKQIVSLSLALAAFAAMALIPHRVLTKHAGRILLIGFALCALLVIFGNILKISQITLCTNGACRWFSLGPLGTIQPAEFLKFGFLLFFASFLGIRSKQGLIDDVQKTLLPLGMALGIAAIFIIGLQNDMGTGIALFGIVTSMLVIGGISKRRGIVLVGGALAVGVLFILIAPHRMDRITTFLRGDHTTSSTLSDDSSHQITQAKIAIGSGGWSGVGIGSSVQATGYLPEAINDSVFAIMGEIFGFIGLTAILALFTGLLLRLLKVLDHVGDMQLKLIVGGVFSWLATHIILNVASMIGIFPLTGITLPLLSFGGTSMLFVAGALGLVFQLSRYTSHRANYKETQNENSSSRRGIGRTRHSGGRSTSRA